MATCLRGGRSPGFQTWSCQPPVTPVSLCSAPGEGGGVEGLGRPEGGGQAGTQQPDDRPPALASEPWSHLEGPPTSPFRLSFKSHPRCVHSRKNPLPFSGHHGAWTSSIREDQTWRGGQRRFLLHPQQPAQLTAVLRGCVLDGQRDIKKDGRTQGWTGGHMDGRVDVWTDG